VQECCFKAQEEKESPEIIGRLLQHYYEVNAGIGVHKSPALYGAFPTDPYSHTPAGKGAQQPGMTGQVKEDVLSRFGELGVFVKKGCLYFAPLLLRKEEFLSEAKTFHFVDVFMNQKTIELQEDSLCFTYCQTPIVYKIGNSNSIEVTYSNGTEAIFDSNKIDVQTSQKLFLRTGEIIKIKVTIDKIVLR
jgi:hypothetical protein